ncbi:hypothetical protein CYMTET_18535 [Cymbomonas tetramitiformis]|uniref:Uncharacterized protein n=1 Tax=Cymbomonas tetramitiformis TaxID=36881 RepID=A0AAE0G8B7_9CHLO|nr:hypothetical protein CYMTET_18535 [Cymbomonas tetramitiformis]
MFDALVSILRKASEWEQHGEKQISEYAFKEYLSPPYNRWLYSASNTPGVDASSQPLKSYNGDTKKNKQMHMRAQLDEFLTTSLPNLLWIADSADLTAGTIHRHAPADLIPAEWFEKARQFVDDDVLEHPAGSGAFYLNTKVHLGRKIKACHVELYAKGVLGTAKIGNRTTSDKFQTNFMSLHKVYFDPSFQLEEGEEAGLWRCDYKGFWHGVVCSHVLKVRSLKGEISLEEATAPLPKRKPAGKRARATPALVRQPDSPAQKKQRSKRARK